MNIGIYTIKNAHGLSKHEELLSINPSCIEAAEINEISETKAFFSKLLCYSRKHSLFNHRVKS